MRHFNLEDICEIQIGKTPSRAEPTYWNGDLPWATISDLSNCRVLQDTKEGITEIGATKSGSKLIPSGTLLLSFKLSLGKRAITARNLFTNEAIAALSIKDPKIAYREYLYWALGSVNYDKIVDRAAKGKTLNKAKLRRLPIPLPPLAEQKRIAGVLDAADALRAKRREAIAQLDTLLQATFLEMFGDPVTNPKGWEFGTIRDVLSACNYGSSEKASESVAGFPMLRMNNITYTGEWDFGSLKYIDLGPKEQKKYLVHQGELLFNRTNSKELVGKSAVYRRKEPMAFAGYLVRGVVNGRADPEYLGAFMNTPQIKTFLRNKCKSIVGMANINAQEFQAIPLPIPPLTPQKQFAALVEVVEQRKTHMRAHLTELDTLFASLQSRAFRGEL